MKLDKREAGSGNQMPRLYQLSNLGYLTLMVRRRTPSSSSSSKRSCSLDFLMETNSDYYTFLDSNVTKFNVSHKAVSHS